jgi:protein-S-isoprenylcysteine O-methyltransferase Ste14
MLAVALWLLYAVPAYVLYTLAFRLRYGFSPVAERFPPRTLYQWMDTLLFCVLTGYSAWLVLGPWPQRSDAISVPGGVALWVAGVALRWWAIAALGRHWRIGQDESDGRAEFVARGPYRFVRHPINIGLLLVAGGMVLLSGLEVRALILLGYAVVYYLVQGPIEDRRWRESRPVQGAGHPNM